MAMQAMLIAWSLLVIHVVRRTIARGSVGLPTALVICLSFLYGGCFVYAVPGYSHSRSAAHIYLQRFDFSELMIAQATFVSLIGLAGFALGAGVLSGGAQRQKQTRAQATFISRNPLYEKRFLTVAGGIALVSYTLHTLRVSFPLSAALFEAGRNLAMVVICLGAGFALRNRTTSLPWLILASLIPLYYVVVWGFVSYGFLYGTVFLGFWLAQLRRPDRTPLTLPLRFMVVVGGIYFLLTLFVGWFSFREEIRLIVWQQSEGSILAIVQRALSETQIFSIWNFDSLDMINIRLNLNIFIARMMEQHSLFPDLQQYGATLIIIPLVFVPRFMWPDKPERGGNEFMSEHTGLVFADGVTFGAGPLFEFYVNFGVAGVFLGFVAFGWLIAQIDKAAARHLTQGDFMSFARLFLVGIVVLDPLLRPFFLANGAAFAWILMSLMKFTFERTLRERSRGSRARAALQIRRRPSSGGDA